MKVVIEKDNALIVVPETEFETNFIAQAFNPGENLKCFVKHGLSSSIVVGIKIEPSTDK